MVETERSTIDVQQFLASTFLFQDLSEEQLTVVEQAASVKNIPKGSHLFSDGQPATAFFIVVTGRLKIYKLSTEGNEQILHVQNDNDLIAEAVIFDFDTYPAYCQALEDATLIRISRTDFIDMLHRFPEICFRIMGAYSRRLRLLVSKIEEISLHDIKSRVANYLMNHSQVQDNRWLCTLTLTKKDLASMLGTIPETLSRTLHFFKQQKLIEEKKNTIVILNREKLKSLCL
ncbi:MAG: Crp/Fnr family transcriptional regulator [Candidatus Zhuqueibacterota bacterium]